MLHCTYCSDLHRSVRTDHVLCERVRQAQRARTHSTGRNWLWRRVGPYLPLVYLFSVLLPCLFYLVFLSSIILILLLFIFSTLFLTSFLFFSSILLTLLFESRHLHHHHHHQHPVIHSSDRTSFCSTRLHPLCTVVFVLHHLSSLEPTPLTSLLFSASISLSQPHVNCISLHVKGEQVAGVQEETLELSMESVEGLESKVSVHGSEGISTRRFSQWR